MELTKIPNRMHNVVFIMMLLVSTFSFSRSLTVGVGVSGPPIVERINTAQGPYYFGFCIDLMNNICKRIGETCTYYEITLNNQFELLNKGKIDLLILTKPYTPLEQEQYATSVPYAVSKIQFITSKNSPINNVGDIKNKKIGVIKTTFYNLLTQSSYHNDNQIIAYNFVSDLLSDLAQNKVDVIVLNNAIAYSFINNNIYNIKLVGHAIPLGEGYGIIALSDKEALITEINKAILSIEKDGTYTSIYQKYYGH